MSASYSIMSEEEEKRMLAMRSHDRRSGKRRDAVAASEINQSEILLPTPKPEIHLRLIVEALRSNDYTRDYPDCLLEELATVAQGPKSLAKGETIIHEGRSGDRFFILVEGECGVFKYNREIAKHEKVNVMKAGQAFGELALLYKAPRAASVVADTDCVYYEYTDNGYKNWKMMKQRELEARYEKFLQRVPGLNELTNQELYAIAQACRPEVFKAGVDIITQGTDGDKFYMIESGKVDIIVNGKKVNELTAPNWFGERALITKEKRNATVRASETCTCASLDSKSFYSLIGQRGEQVLTRK